MADAATYAMYLLQQQSHIGLQAWPEDQVSNNGISG